MAGLGLGGGLLGFGEGGADHLQGATWARPGDVIDIAKRRGHGGIDDEGDQDEDGDEGTGVPVGVS